MFTEFGDNFDQKYMNYLEAAVDRFPPVLSQIKNTIYMEIVERLLNDAAMHTDMYDEKNLPDYTARNMKYFNIFKGKTEMAMLKKVQQITNSML